MPCARGAGQPAWAQKSPPAPDASVSNWVGIPQLGGTHTPPPAGSMGGTCSKSSRCRFPQGASATRPYGELQRVGDHSVGVRQKNSSSLRSGPSGPGAMASRSTRPRASAAARAAPRSGASFAGSGHLPGGLASGVGRQSKGSTSGPWVGIEAESEPDRGLAQTRTGRLVSHALRSGSRAGVSGLAEFFCRTGRQPVGAPHTAGSPRAPGKNGTGSL